MDATYQIKKAAGGLVLIRWGHACDAHGCIQGDCFVVVREDDEESESAYEFDAKPMTLGEIRRYIAVNPHLLGSMINDCRGIVQGEKVFVFETPIQVRNGS